MRHDLKVCGSRLMRIGRLCFPLLAFVSTTCVLMAKPTPKPKRAAATSAVPMAKPEDEGFSSERLQRIHEAMQRHIDAGEIAGVVTLVSKNGKIVYYEAHGMANIAAKKPMQKDYIFNMASAS